MGHDQYTHATSPSVDMAISYNWRTCKVHLLVNIFAWPCKSMSNHCRTRYSDDLFRISISNSRWTQWRYLHEKIFLAIGNDNVPLFNQCNCKYHCNQRTLDSAIPVCNRFISDWKRFSDLRSLMLLMHELFSV